MNHQEILAKGVEVLSDVINLSTGLSHPLDEARAKELLRGLHKKGIATPFDAVYSEAKKNGWPARHAEQFATLAEGVNNGKSVRVSQAQGWGEPTLERIINGEFD